MNQLRQNNFATLGGLAVALVALLVGSYFIAESQSSTSELTIFGAVVLGLVEGITEYLPVSSTGHLLVTNELLGIGQTDETEAALDTYAIAIQIGAIFAVLVLYKNRVMQMFSGLFGRSEEGRSVTIAVAAAFIPTAIIGLTLKDFVQERLFGTSTIALAWLVGGIAILAITKSNFMRSDGQGRSGVDIAQMTLVQAAGIGVAQCLALWPGTSRSLVTILAGLLVGLSLRAAVEFSFLLGLITLSAATVLATAEGGSELVAEFGYLNPIVGLVVAFVAAIVSVKWMVTWLEQKSFGVFGVYRIAIGLLAFVALSANWIS